MTHAQLYHLHLECLGLSGAEKKAAIAEFSERCGRKADTVRKALSKMKQGKAGPKQARVSPRLSEAVKTIWEFKLTPDGPLATEAAQSLALSEGRLTEAHAVSSLNSAAKTMGLNADSDYCRRMEAEHANQVHRVDLSGSRHFRVVDEITENGRRDHVLEIVRAEQRNKRWRDGELLWLLVLIDDYSRLINAAYEVAPGESAAMVQRFCVNTWRNGDPLGMPSDTLICDQGSFGKETSTRALMEHFDITLELGMPYNSKRNGRIERPIRDFKAGFERSYLVTHRIGGTVRLSKLRDELVFFIGKSNERRHPVRRDRTKRQDWERSMGFRELRECPEDALLMATYRVERTVGGDGTIQHDNRLLQAEGLPFGLAGRKVTLCYNRSGDLVAEHDGRAYPVSEFQPVTLGKYDSAGLKGRREPPAAAAAKAAADRPRTSTGLFTPERERAISGLGEKLNAPGEAVREDLPAPITPPVRSVPAARKADPFAAPPSRHASLEDAREALEGIVGKPLWLIARKDAGRIARIDRILETELNLDCRKVADFAAKLRSA